MYLYKDTGIKTVKFFTGDSPATAQPLMTTTSSVTGFRQKYYIESVMQKGSRGCIELTPHTRPFWESCCFWRFFSQPEIEWRGTIKLDEKSVADIAFSRNVSRWNGVIKLPTETQINLSEEPIETTEFKKLLFGEKTSVVIKINQQPMLVLYAFKWGLFSQKNGLNEIGQLHVDLSSPDDIHNVLLQTVPLYFWFIYGNYFEYSSPS